MDLPSLPHPIALRSEYIATAQTTLHIQQHESSKKTGEDLTVSKWPQKSTSINPEDKLLSITSKWAMFSARRFIRDATGLPLYDLFQNKGGVTWHACLPGLGNKGENESLMAIAPRYDPLRYKFDVYVRNVGEDQFGDGSGSGDLKGIETDTVDGTGGKGEEVLLKVRGQDVQRVRTNVYLGEEVVMTALRVDNMRSLKKLEYKVEVAEGLDVSLASMIVIVMAYMLNQTGRSSYKGAGDHAESNDGK